MLSQWRKSGFLSLLIRKNVPDKCVGLFEPSIGELAGNFGTGIKAQHDQTRADQMSIKIVIDKKGNILSRSLSSDRRAKRAIASQRKPPRHLILHAVSLTLGAVADHAHVTADLRIAFEEEAGDVFVRINKLRALSVDTGRPILVLAQAHTKTKQVFRNLTSQVNC